ncbi:MAG: DUF262 domain-containing protein [Lentisphaeria bacterium]|nr:DUF262 domain-containing protein [Lentisphaeria bacterium]
MCAYQPELLLDKEAAEQQIIERSKRIDYYIVEYSIGYLADQMNARVYYVPDYQRNYTWDEPRKWRFIESIIMGLPIPFLFFYENAESGKLEIVDGSQRLRTIHEFIYENLKLDELDRLPTLNGFTFKDLPEARQRKILNKSIRGIVLTEQTDEEARRDLFERINTGSLVANPAEIRRGSLAGPFVDMVGKLAHNSLFEQLAPVSEKQANLKEREELVTRFFAYSDGLDEYADEVSPFLFAYTKRMNKKLSESSELIEEYEQRFINMLNFVQKYFPLGFRKTKNGKATPRTRFEAISVGSYWAYTEQPGLVPKDVSTWIDTDEFKKIIRSDGANVTSKLQERINSVKNYLLEGVKDNASR